MTIYITPYEAIWIAHWLRSQHEPTGYQGILGEFLYRYRDHHDVDAVAAKFEKIIARKRSGGRYARIAVQIPRKDAEWFGKHVRRSSIFARGMRERPLPPIIKLLCSRCALATTKRRGRPKLTGSALKAAVTRQAEKYAEGQILEQRHLKRLRRRQREDAAMDRLLGRPIKSLSDQPAEPEKN